jgi:hypothetical protein
MLLDQGTQFFGILPEIAVEPVDGFAHHRQILAMRCASSASTKRSFLAEFLQQLEVDGSDIVDKRIAIDYILELTSGVTGPTRRHPVWMRLTG